MTMIKRSGFPLTIGPEPPLQGSHVQQVKSYYFGRSCHQTQQFLKLSSFISFLQLG